MKLQKDDLINKIEALNGFLREENKRKLDKTFYNDLCNEVDEFVSELKESNVEFVN